MAEERKTVQALTVRASWSPSPAMGIAALNAIFNEDENSKFDDAPLKLDITGGNLKLRKSFKAEFTDLAKGAEINRRIAELKGRLEDRGTVHDFTVTAGAVPMADAEVVTLPPAEDSD